MINAEQAREGLVKAIEEKGADYIYEHWQQDCFYAKEGKPSCIVGHAVNNIDHELFVALAEEEAKCGVMSVHSVSSVKFDTEALIGLTAAQREQDSGSPWEESLSAFDNAITNFRLEHRLPQ